MSFSVSGLMSGIDYKSMIEQIMELERQPITRMETRQTAFKKKISLYGDLSSKLEALKTASEGLKTATDFYTRSTSVSDEAVFNATASSTAVAGNYTVAVTKLAQAHRIASSPVASETTAVSSTSGDFTFQVGDGDATTVAVTATTTLADLRNAINAAEGDAEATIINDGTGFRLVLTSGASGVENDIAVTANATTLGLPTGPVPGGVQLQAAQDAVFTIDGLPMTRSTNTVEGAISGVAITLKTEGTSTLSVTNDTAAIQEKIESFVAAYNEVVALVSSNAAYDSTTGTGGPFTGEATARDVVTQLQWILGSRVTGLPDELRSLSQIGIKTGTDGTLSIDNTVLTDKVNADLGGVADLFSSESGVANSVWNYADKATDSITGSITYRQKGLGTIVTKISNDIEKVEARLEKQEESLIQRFAKLEAMLTNYSSQASYLSSLFTTSSS